MGTTVANGRKPTTLIPYGGGYVNASSTVQAGDSLITIPFDSSKAIPLISRGYILDPGDNGGAIVFKKNGIYELQLVFRACVLAGGLGVFELFEYNNGVKVTNRDFAVDVDFANDRKNVTIDFTLPIAISDALLTAVGGSYSKDFRVKTSDAAITWRYGNTTFTSGQAVSFGLHRLCDYFI